MSCMVFLLLVGQNRNLMGDQAIGKLLRVAGWAPISIVSAISVYFLWQQFGSGL